jgi:hypothetical protein
MLSILPSEPSSGIVRKGGLLLDSGSDSHGSRDPIRSCCILLYQDRRRGRDSGRSSVQASLACKQPRRKAQSLGCTGPPCHYDS